MSSAADRYYRPSGYIPMLGLFKLVLVGTPVLSLTTLVYATLCRYCMINKVKIAIAIVFCFVVFWLASSLVKWVRIRSRWFSGLIGLLLGGAVIYWSWVWFPCALSDWDPQMIIFDPLEQYAVAQWFAENGVWILDGIPIDATILYVVWSTEAAGIVVAAVAGAVRERGPYCEVCDRWLELAAAFDVRSVDEGRFREDLESERYAVLSDLQFVQQSAGTTNSRGIHLQVLRCHNCDDLFLLSAFRVRGPAWTCFIKNLYLSPEGFAALLEHYRHQAALEMPDYLA